jgi:hypothetical protein
MCEATRPNPWPLPPRTPHVDTGTDEVIPLPNVNGKILAKVIEYCKYHVDAAKKGADDKPAKSEDEVKSWDTDFVKVDQATLFDLILVRAMRPVGARDRQQLQHMVCCGSGSCVCHTHTHTHTPSPLGSKRDKADTAA